MEGPTPVSALIHAATMVTAGVFLLIKCSPIFEYSPKCLYIILVVGLVTTIFAASSGLVQSDIKKIIAYSTCSQLGYMVFSCGLSQYNISLFHLVNHAIFKALLFLSAGSIIHSVQNEQDLRKFGGIGKLIPFTIQVLLVGSLALVGFPFLTGFYSKDLIIEVAFSCYTISSHFCFTIALLTTFFTCMYSYKILYLTIILKSNSYKYIIKRVHDSLFLICFSLFILSFGSFLFGYFLKELFVGFGTDY